MRTLLSIVLGVLLALSIAAALIMTIRAVHCRTFTDRTGAANVECRVIPR